MKKRTKPNKLLSLEDESKLIELKAKLSVYGSILAPKAKAKLEAAIQALES